MPGTTWLSTVVAGDSADAPAAHTRTKLPQAPAAQSVRSSKDPLVRKVCSQREYLVELTRNPAWLPAAFDLAVKRAEALLDAAARRIRETDLASHTLFPVPQEQKRKAKSWRVPALHHIRNAQPQNEHKHMVFLVAMLPHLVHLVETADLDSNELYGITLLEWKSLISSQLPDPKEPGKFLAYARRLGLSNMPVPASLLTVDQSHAVEENWPQLDPDTAMADWARDEDDEVWMPARVLRGPINFDESDNESDGGDEIHTVSDEHTG